MTPDLWAVDSVVLARLIHVFEVEGQVGVRTNTLDVEGVPADQVGPAVRRLHADGLVKGSMTFGQSWPTALHGVTPEGLRRAGAWPSAEQLPARLAKLLEATAARVPEPEQRSVLQRAAAVVGGSAREIVVGLAIAQGSG